MNFFGEAWTETLEVLRKEGYRVIVPDQIGLGRSSKPILHYFISTHAANTKRHLGVKTIGHCYALDGWDGGEPLRFVLTRRGWRPRDDQSDRPDSSLLAARGIRTTSDPNRADTT